MFCCHMLSHTVRKPCAAATVELNPIKRSANKADFGVFDPIRSVSASIPIQFFFFNFIFSHTVLNKLKTGNKFESLYL